MKPKKDKGKRRCSPETLFLSIAFLIIILLCLLMKRPGRMAGPAQTGEAPKETEANNVEEETAVEHGEDEWGEYMASLEEEDACFRELLEKTLASRHYDNSHILSCTISGHGVLYLGTDCSLTDALYLDPVFIPEEDLGRENAMSGVFRKYAFYISDPLMGIEYAVKEMQDREEGYFYLPGRTLDTAVPAEFEDHTRYGIRWRDWLEEETENVTLSIRVVDLRSGELQAIVHAEIRKEKGVYSLWSLENGDERGRMGTEEYASAVNQAGEFIHGGGGFRRWSLPEGAWDCAEAFIERTNRPYFPRLYSPEGESIPAADLLGRELYAVSFACPEAGTVTVYMDREGEGWSVVGYDPLFAFSKETLHFEG